MRSASAALPRIFMMPRQQAGRMRNAIVTVAVATVAVAGAALITGNGTVIPTNPSGVDIWVATNGNDSTCVRGNQALPCATLNKAYTLASCGDEIEVGNGTYSATQNINSRSALNSCTNRVVFEEAPSGSGAVFTNEVSINEPASHIELRDLTINPYINIGYASLSGGCSAPAQDIKLVNIDVQSFHMSCVNGLDWDGGDVGPSNSDTVEHPYINDATGYIPANITLDGIYFHDAIQGSSSGTHTECLLVVAADGLIVQNSTFWNCQSTGPLYITVINLDGAQATCLGIVLQNNWFFGNGSQAVHLESDCEIVARYNSFSAGAFPFLLPYDNHLGGTLRSVTLIGNYGNGPRFEGNGSCDSLPAGFSFSYNAWLNMTCAATDTSVGSLQFVSGTDLHLTPGANAIDKGSPTTFPSTDFDGDPRPLGAAADAGSDEKG